MFAGIAAWWIARITELCPRFILDVVYGPPNAIIFETEPSGAIRANLRRGGRETPGTLGVAVRMAQRWPPVLRVGAAVVLEKRHVVPTMPRRDLASMLRHEISRITPFPADDLFWHWTSRSMPADRTRTEVTLTMVPRRAVARVLDQLNELGIQPRILEVGPTDRPRRLPVQGSADRRPLLATGLAWTCACLAVGLVVLPFLLQSITFYETGRAIDVLRPAVAEAQALRHDLTAETDGRTRLTQEIARTGDIVSVLAMLTRLLPDDTFLTDFTFRNRQISMGGRSASAPRLITGLSAEPSIRGAAFAAPVTHSDGTTADVFTIQAEVAP
jgi:general secretion pathway protein L